MTDRSNINRWQCSGSGVWRVNRHGAADVAAADCARDLPGVDRSSRSKESDEDCETGAVALRWRT